MSKRQTAELHAWRAIERQQHIERAIARLRDVQLRLHIGRSHAMPRPIILHFEWMVGLRLDELWAAQQGEPQPKLVEIV